jgi:hypothetical protein
MKLKIFWTTKEMVSKLKSTLIEWEKNLSNYQSDKRLITRIYKELKKLNSQKNQWPNKEMGNWIEQNLFKRRSPNN